MQHRYHKSYRIFFTVFVLALQAILLAGCGGGGGGGGGATPPTANAGPDQTASENQIVALDGNQSSASSGTIQAYQWLQRSGPSAVLVGANTATPDFTAPLVSADAELIFELTVTDDRGIQDKDEVSVLVMDNIAPVANAGANQQAIANQVVSLDGSQSNDSDGSIVTYMWKQLSGSSVIGDPGFDSSSPTPSFTAPDVGEKLSFSLTVTDDLGLEHTDEVDIYISRVLFEDDFNQGLNEGTWIKVDDSAGTGNASLWVGSANVLEQRNYVGAVSQGPAFDKSFHKGTYRYANPTTSLIDYRFQVDAMPMTNGSFGGAEGNDIGVMFRYQNQNNYYRVSMSARYGFTRLEKKVGGQFTSLAVNSIGYFDGTPIEFIIDVKGDLIQVFIDNDPIFSVIDSDLSSGAVALYCQDRAQFDNVSVTDASLLPRVVIASPLAYLIASTDTSDLSVNADVANLPAGAWVEFLVDGGNSQNDMQTPFQSQYTGLTSADHSVTAILRDADDNELSRDTNLGVGVGGGFNLAVGDSITNGSGDRYQSDNTSNDGRIVGRQGFVAELNNQLTDNLGLPQIVFNEGIPGDTTSFNLLIRIDSILSRHPRGKNVFLLLGTNDATQSVSSFDYFNRMQQIVDIIDNANMTVRVAQVPPIFDINTGLPNNSANTRIQGYNSELANLTNTLPGPDFYTYFLDNAGLFSDHLHPNSLGHACVAKLWNNSITGASDAPFVLNQFQAPTALYQQNLLEAGNEFYIDQSYTLESIPMEVASGIWIMTANGDATDTSANFIRFDLDRAVTVYVAYDGRNGTVFPTWLTSSFTNTGLQVDTSVGMFDLFSKNEAVGTVTLGGNQANGGTGVLNYFVVVVAN